MPFDQLLAASPLPAPTLRAWYTATASARAAFTHPIDRALISGAHADRLGFAFAAGYAEALRALVPSLDGITALCATEEGGAHPRAIRTTLTASPTGGFLLRGRKKWATVANEASSLLVVASVGEDGTRNRLRVARVPATARGVTIRSSPAPFVPEIEHAELELDDVAVPETDILPGDGYDDYLKPFRTVEDLHVHAALLGYLIGLARRRSLAPTTIENLLALAASTRAIADASPKSAATHLALAGLLDLATRAVADVEREWSALPADDESQRWQRDRPLLQVAAKARTARREAARAALLAR